MYATLHLLNRPSLICFDARASTESNPTIIFTMTSVIMGCGSGRNRRIDIQTLEKVAQALEQLEKSIVARCNSTGSLSYSYITKEMDQERIRGTYRNENFDPNKQSLRWWEGDLTKSVYKSNQIVFVAHQGDRLAKDP